MKEALKFIAAIIILTAISLAAAFCAGETMSRL